jgi:hypothetical protein
MDLYVLVCGGRNYTDQEVVDSVLDNILRKYERYGQEREDLVILHGAATGADTCAKRWAEKRNIRQRAMPADWSVHGKAAGPKRNEEMANLRPVLCVAFPGGRGTADMVRRCKAKKIRVVEVSTL